MYMHPLFEQALNGEELERPPVWLMRQAGRYLPRYRELRTEYTFREAISTPEVAEEISLLPYERFGVDGVIMYSDILTILEPLGIEYRIESGVGPVIDAPIRTTEDVPTGHRPMDETVGFVGELLDRIRAHVGDSATTIGFAGGPFTVASYLVAGEPTKNHAPIRRARVADAQLWTELLDVLTEATIDYVQYQEAAGAEVIQLFDTYAGLLGPSVYREELLPRHERILAAVDVPTIMFAKGVSGHLQDLAATGADAVSVDWTVDMEYARQQLGPAVPVQGNLDPIELFASPSRIVERTESIIEAAGPYGHILNLGHGILRDTPPEHVATFVETAQSFSHEDAR